VGEHLLKRRRDLGLTQVKVAAVLRVNVTTITTWEKNRQEPTGDHLAGIVRFLGYDPGPASLRLTAEEVRDRLAV
jgi:transcriptional regulator with XRE-family HTH domain